MISKSTCSLPELTAAGHLPSCPACGYPDLPEMQPETLHLLVGAESCAGCPLPDGRLPVHARDRIYLMRPEQWSAYKRLCRSREGMAAKLEGGEP